MTFLKLAAFSIVTVFLVLQLRNGKQEYGILLTLALVCIMGGYILNGLMYIYEQMCNLDGVLEGNGTYLKIILKIVGITYVSELCSGIARDAGCHGISGQIEICGKLCILLTGFPIVLTLIETIGFLK